MVHYPVRSSFSALVEPAARPTDRLTTVTLMLMHSER